MPVRLGAEQLIESGQINGRLAEALRLYAGLDGNEGRSYQEVGELIGLSGERVRQLVSSSKHLLESMDSSGDKYAPATPNMGDALDIQSPANSVEEELMTRDFTCYRLIGNRSEDPNDALHFIP